MQEVSPIVRCGCDNTPFTHKQDRSGWVCSHGHEIGNKYPELHRYCPRCMNNEYLALRELATFQEPPHYNILIFCSNPMCPRYRVSVSPDGKLCSMFTSKHNRLFMLDLRSGSPVLIYKKNYGNNWLNFKEGSVINKNMNRYIRLLFFKALACRKIKLINGSIVYTK